MTGSADAVVIGGGILGASTAYFLARLGFGRIVLLERGELASGATRHSAAHVRQHYSNEVAIRLVLRALRMFTHDEEELGGPTAFTRTGYLVISDAAEADGLRRNVELQRRLGVETRLVEPDEIAELFPELDLHGVALGAHEPGSGCADPVLTVRSLAAAAERLGAEVRERTPAVAIRSSHGSVDGVTTPAGEIDAPVVVNCAGPWANRVAALAGGAYSLRLSREEEAIFESPLPTERLPIVSDAPGRVYFRPSGPGRLLAGFGYPKELQPVDPDRCEETADEASIEWLAAAVARRFPGAAGKLRAVASGAGVYSITDDWYPIVGRSPWAEGLWEAVGGSGHCFKLGPPIGEALAHLIAGLEPPVDVSSLSGERFDRGAALGSVWGAGNRA